MRLVLAWRMNESHDYISWIAFLKLTSLLSYISEGQQYSAGSQRFKRKWKLHQNILRVELTPPFGAAFFICAKMMRI